MSTQDVIEAVLVAAVCAVPWVLYFGYVMKP